MGKREGEARGEEGGGEGGGQGQGGREGVGREGGKGGMSAASETQEMFHRYPDLKKCFTAIPMAKSLKCVTAIPIAKERGVGALLAGRVEYLPARLSG